ncbi:rhodanese-like domain-containing protein [Candidatus Sumerlaeota bacterium]|nr:rhodanese-like domain-containing protein [Candidatus Sumerlaeota bacterium]
MRRIIKTIMSFASALCPCALLFACASNNHREFDESALWIDVRTAQEFESGHIEGAINIPYDVIAENIAGVAPDKSAPIRLYCRSGRRSGIAQKTLAKLGYTDLVNEGGYKDVLARYQKK